MVPTRLTAFEARRKTEVGDQKDVPDPEEPGNERKMSLPEPLSKIEL